MKRSHTTLTDIVRESWCGHYPGITWVTVKDGDRLHIIGTHNGREERRTVDWPLLRDDHGGLVNAIDEACSAIADELTGEAHLAYLERIGPLNEPFPLACEHHFAPINKNRVGACKCVHCGLVSHNVIPSLPASI